MVNYKNTAPVHVCDSLGDALPRDSIILAQGKGKHFIRVDRFEEAFRRFDGQESRYRLFYAELSDDCESPDDENWCQVKYSENQWWKPSELAAIGIHVRRTKQGMYDADYNVFDHVNLF
jgi:hypothetical protein